MFSIEFKSCISVKQLLVPLNLRFKHWTSKIGIALPHNGHDGYV